MEVINNKINKHILFKLSLFIGIFILMLILFIIFSAPDTSAETSVMVQDVASNWINENSGARHVLNLTIHNNSGGSGNSLFLINVTFYNVSGFQTSDLSSLTNNVYSGVLIYQESNSIPGFQLSDQEAIGLTPTWNTNISHCWAIIFIDPLYNSIPSSPPANPNYYVVINTSSTISNGDDFRINITEYSINGTWGSAPATPSNTKIIQVDTIDPTISSPSVTESSSYIYASGTSIYYGDDMAATETFDVTGSASDSGGSGLDRAVFSSNQLGSPSNDYTPTTWAGKYNSVSSSDTWTGSITVWVFDYAGNFNIQIFTVYRDTINPTITYNSPSAGGSTTWYNSNPGSVIDIDFIWGGSGNSPLDYASYQIGSSGWVNIFTVDQSFNYVSNWGVTWASLSESNNDIQIRVFDAVGNSVTHTYVASTSGFRFRKDTTPPSITYTYPTAGGSTSSYSSDPGNVIDIDFIWSSNSPLVNASYKIGSGSWVDIFSTEQSSDYTTNWGISWSTLAEGDNDISLRVTDKAGNINIDLYISSTSGFRFVKSSSNTPLIVYNNPIQGGATNWYSSDPGNIIDIDFKIVGASPLMNASYRIGIGPWIYIFNSEQASDYTTNWGISWNGLSEGANEISIRVYNKADFSRMDTYVASTSGFIFRKDTLNPTIIYNYPSAGGNSSWYKSDPGSIIDIDFNWIGNSPLDYAQYKIGDGNWIDIFTISSSADYTENWNISWDELLEGKNEINIRVADAAGNILANYYSEGIYGFIFRKDTQAPNIDSFSINNNDVYTKSTHVTLIISADDDTSGIYQMRISNDGVFDTESWELFATIKSWTLPTGDGTKEVYILVRDYALKESALISSDSIILDTTAPSLSALVLTPSNITEDTISSLVITINITDGSLGSGVNSVKINYSISNTNISKNIAMEKAGTGQWEYVIDPTEFGYTWDELQGYSITYVIRVEDKAGNVALSNKKVEYIDPINDPPVITGAPIDLQVIAEVDYELNFEPFISDIDSKITDILLITDTKYATVSGLVIKFNYPLTVNLEEVTITVSDGIDSTPWKINVTVKIPKEIRVITKDQITIKILISKSGDASINNIVKPPASPPGEFTNVLTFTVNITTNDWDWMYIEIDYSGFNSSKINIQSITFYYWDFESSSWKKVDAYDIDRTNLKISTNVTKIFTFAIFANPIEPVGKDVDGDGINDAWEETYGLDPSDKLDANDDLDEDGLTNLEEFLNDTNPKLEDSDNDGLTDGDEVLKYQTNPNNDDSDNDGYSDKKEIDSGSDPNDVTSVPKKDEKDKGFSGFGTVGGIDILFILIIIIIIIIFLAYFAARRRKPEEAEEEEELEEEEDEEDVERETVPIIDWSDAGKDEEEPIEEEEFEAEMELEEEIIPTEEIEPDIGLEEGLFEDTELETIVKKPKKGKKTLEPPEEVIEEMPEGVLDREPTPSGAIVPKVMKLKNRSIPCGICLGTIKAGLMTVKCRCGKFYHDTCAVRVAECPKCDAKFDKKLLEDAINREKEGKREAEEDFSDMVEFQQDFTQQEPEPSEEESEQQEPDPLEILKQRLAKGEIDFKTYKEMKKEFE